MIELKENPFNTRKVIRSGLRQLMSQLNVLRRNLTINVQSFLRSQRKLESQSTILSYLVNKRFMIYSMKCCSPLITSYSLSHSNNFYFSRLRSLIDKKSRKSSVLRRLKQLLKEEYSSQSNGKAIAMSRMNGYLRRI